MPSVANTKIIYGGPPNGKPVPGETLKVDNSETIDLDNVELPENAFLAKTLSLSLDPYQRGKMTKPDPKRYTAAYEPGKVIYNFGVVEVLKSTDPKYQVGQKLYGIFPFQKYTVIDKPPLGATVGDKGGYKIIENSEGLSWTAWVGACGMPGKTADYGWKEFSKAKPGEKVFVTSAYGPVGSLVCQLAKESGCEVIASAGSDAKVEWLKKELGVKAFNYKTSDTAKELEDFGGVDIYWDGVGGETLDAALGASKNGARFIECGMISGYNSGEGTHLKNIMKIIGNNLTISGFIVSVLEDKYVDDFYKAIPKHFAEGKFKFKEHVVEGLENTPEAFLAMLNGENDGKVAIKVAN